MRKSLIWMPTLLILAGLVTFGAKSAEATPSTQIWIPSTDTQAFGTVHLGVDNYTTIFKKAEDGGGDFPTTMGLTFGVGETESLGLEIGFDLKEPSDDPIFLNAKIQLIEDSLFSFFPAIAIGGYDFGTNSEETDFNITYILMAKTFSALGRLSIGYYYGNESLLLDAEGEKDNSGVLASFDRTLAEIDDRLWIAIDYMGGNNSYGALSFGFAWRFAENMSAILGYDIFNETKTGGENTVTVQFDIDL